MRGRLRVLLGRLRASYWFLPTLMTIAAFGLSYATIALDRSFEGSELPAWATPFAGGPEGAREVLSTIAGSIITVAGVTFSISIVTLSLAAQQYGPRLLRNFMRDRAVHVAFGFFAATYIHSLLVLRSTHGSDGVGGEAFVPHASVTAAVVLAVVDVFVLIFFMHHTARSIHSSNLARTTAGELREAIVALFPPRSELKGEVGPTVIAERGAPLRTRVSGYVQAIDVVHLVRGAEARDVVLRLRALPGAFVVAGDVVAEAIGLASEDAKLASEVDRALLLGLERTVEQDVAFGFELLAEMAIRALSPSLNDPFTAAQCLDRVRESLLLMASRGSPPAVYRDRKGNPRLLFAQPSVAALLRRTVLHVLNYAGESPLVLQKLQELVASVAARSSEGATAARDLQDQLRASAARCLSLPAEAP